MPAETPIIRFFPGSIRLRLTLWYAALFALVLGACLVALSALLERQLRNDLDDRLRTTAAQVAAALPPDALAAGGSAGGDDLALDPFVFPGLVAQLVDASGAVVANSGNAPASPLPMPELPPGGEEPVYRTARLGDVELRTVRYPLVADEGGQQRVVGSIVVGESFLPLDRTLARLRRLLIAAGLVGMGLAAVGGWLLAGRALRPVANVTATAAGIAEGANTASSLRTRLAVPPTGDEVARLAATFNAMLDRLESSFGTQRRFVADASHELRTPLTALRTNLDVLLAEAADEATPLDRPELLATLDGMRRTSARMARLLDDLLLLARLDAAGSTARETARRRPVRLDREVTAAVRALEPLAEERALVVTAAPVSVAGDADRLHQLALILLENAVRYTPAGGRIAVEIGPDGFGAAKLVVRDSGIGIAPEHLPRVFDRFYRADEARARATGGAGLGLAIARAIVESHGGAIAVASRPGEGATFTVSLPVTRSEGEGC